MAVQEVGGVLLLMISACYSQLIPSQYTVIPHGLAVNGSSPTGHCTHFYVKGPIDDVLQTTCFQPNTSVLFNGNTPKLTIQMNEYTWAEQLLTLNVSHGTTRIKFNFSMTIESIEGVRIVLFNCPDWGMGVENVTLKSGFNFSDHDSPSNYSCEHLVAVYVPCSHCDSTQTQLQLTFQPASDSNMVLLAEVTFYQNESTVSSTNITSVSPPVTSMSSFMPPHNTTITTSTPPLALNTPTPSSSNTPITSPHNNTTSTPPPAPGTPITLLMPLEDTTFSTSTPSPDNSTITIITPTPALDSIITPPANTTFVTSSSPSDSTIIIPTPSPDINLPAPPLDFSIAVSSCPPGITIAMFTTPPDATIIMQANSVTLSTVLSIVLSLFFILVCMMAALLILQRCYFVKCTIKCEEKNHTYEEPFYAVAKNESEIVSTSMSVNLVNTEVDDKLCKNSCTGSEGLYTTLSSTDPNTVYTQIQIKSKELQDGVEKTGGVYASLTNPDPQSEYTQIRLKSKEPLDGSEEKTSGLYESLSKPDPESVYTQATISTL